jgi:hypothetical protein
MNQDNDLQRAAEIDPQVTEQYKSLGSETAPAHLDRAVLREATRAVRADNRKGSFGAWFRPVAFMAMVGLSLAIILDLSDTRIFQPLSDLPFEATPAVEAPQGTAADGANRPTTQPALNEIKRQEKLAADAPDASRDNAAIATPQAVTGDAARTEQGQLQKMRREVVPAGAPPVAESLADQNGASDVLAVEAEIIEERAEQRMQELEANSATNRQSPPDTAAQFAAPQAAVATESLALITPASCSDEQKSDAEAWWQCITSLRQSGLQDAADMELQNLRKSFPDFAAPE